MIWTTASFPRLWAALTRAFNVSLENIGMRNFGPRLVQKHKNKSVDTFSLRVFGEVTASLEVAFQSRSQHWQWLPRASVASSWQASTDAESARIRRPQVIRDSTASILNHADSR